jgi:hypothetical protein
MGLMILPVKTDDRSMTIAAPDLTHWFFRSKFMRRNTKSAKEEAQKT